MSGPFCAACRHARALHGTGIIGGCSLCACQGYVFATDPDRIAAVKHHLGAAVAELRAMVLEERGLPKPEAALWADWLEREIRRLEFEAEVAKVAREVER